jgi:hypothetical protein
VCPLSFEDEPTADVNLRITHEGIGSGPPEWTSMSPTVHRGREIGACSDQTGRPRLVMGSASGGTGPQSGLPHGLRLPSDGNARSCVGSLRRRQELA